MRAPAWTVATGADQADLVHEADGIECPTSESGSEVSQSLSLNSVSLTTSDTSLLLRCSKPTSYGVSVRGAGEVPSLRLSKAVEGVTEPLSPPAFKLRAVLLPKLI